MMIVRVEVVRNIRIAMESKELANRIDHTLLAYDANDDQLKQLCDEAIEFGFHTVCVNPIHVGLAVNHLKDSETKVITVIGFPFGYSETSAKVEETKKAIQNGAEEIDLVVNTSAYRSGKRNYFINDIESVCIVSHLHNVPVKVIIESGPLSDEEIKDICQICVDCQAEYVKTSTGFNQSGALVEDVALMRSVLPATTKIKASGGIRTKEDALKMIEAGADRLGCSSSVKIVS